MRINLLKNFHINSADSMKVLVVTFDSKLTWTKHVSNRIAKSNKALHDIKLIRKFYNKTETLMLLRSNFNSILYYNSEVWHIPKLKPVIKQLLMSASANELKMSLRNQNLLSTQLSIVNILIDLTDLNLSINTFKIKYKKILL